MKYIFAIVLVLHGLLHLTGTAKAFHVAEVARLTRPISRPLGVLWLLAGMLFLATSILVLFGTRGWWIVGAGAIVTSQTAIVTAWSDAKFGTFANVIVLAGVGLGFLSQSSSSLRAEYEQEVVRELARESVGKVVTESDLAPLPPAIQRFVRLVEAVGQPRIRNFRARFHGEIRGGPNERWTSFTGEQLNCYDVPSRLFFMKASRFGVPMQVLHRYVGPSATMRVRVASLFQVVDAEGPVMNESETVTLFNDMVLFAPGTLVDRNIQWTQIDARTVGASFTNAGHTIRAVLTFDDDGKLMDFTSEDRSGLSADGKSFVKMKWSTPVQEVRRFGPHLVVARAEGLWHAPAETFAYIRLELDAIEYNVSATDEPQTRSRE